MKYYSIRHLVIGGNNYAPGDELKEDDETIASLIQNGQVRVQVEDAPKAKPKKGKATKTEEGTGKEE